MKSKIPVPVLNYIPTEILADLRPCQKKAIDAGLFENQKNIVVSSPTGSGKTFVAELAMLDTLLIKRKKVIYVVPLKALASEKFKEFNLKYGKEFRISIAVGDITENYSFVFDILIVTAEKLDSLLRHDIQFVSQIGLVIVDEIHLLHDEKRGPTLEILLTIFRVKFPQLRIIGLSATIGNAKELATWLSAILVQDDWRPVELEHHVLLGDELLRLK